MNQLDLTVKTANSVSIKIISDYDAFMLFLRDKIISFSNHSDVYSNMEQSKGSITISP